MAGAENYNGICIFGSSSSNIKEEYFAAAYEVGRLIGKSGRALIFGAGDRGLMGAAARGCQSSGGEIIGVIPEKLNVKGIYFEGCTQRLVTSTMHERKALMESLAGAFITLPGGFGTVEEFMEVLTLKQLGYFDKPIAVLNVLGCYDHIIAQLEECMDRGFASREYAGLYRVCDTPREAVDYCISYRGMDIRDKLEDALRN